MSSIEDRHPPSKGIPRTLQSDREAVITEKAAHQKKCSESPEVFRFLDLPRDIRLMVYEECRIERKYYDATTDFRKVSPNDTEVALVVCSLPAVKLLRTCTTICEEAGPVFKRQQLYHLATEPIRLTLRGSAAPIYSRWLKDIVLLMAGLRTHSAIAPEQTDLAGWLHAHSWGPNTHSPSQARELSTAESARKERTKLIVCILFAGGGLDNTAWSGAMSETLWLYNALPRDNDLDLRATGTVDVVLRAQCLSDPQKLYREISSAVLQLPWPGIRRGYATFKEGALVEKEEWHRDWVESG